MHLGQKFWTWLDHKLKNDVYELCGSEIVRSRGSRPEDRLRVGDLKSWHIFPEMGFDVVEMTLTDGRRFIWIDKYDDLTAILRRVAPTSELDKV
jgi:hypothetical protein